MHGKNMYFSPKHARVVTIHVFTATNSMLDTKRDIFIYITTNPPLAAKTSLSRTKQPADFYPNCTRAIEPMMTIALNLLRAIPI